MTTGKASFRMLPTESSGPVDEIEARPEEILGQRLTTRAISTIEPIATALAEPTRQVWTRFTSSFL